MRHELWLPHFRPTRLNELLHCQWRTRHRKRKGDNEIFAHYAREQKIPKATGKRRVSLRILMGPRMRRADSDAFDKTTFDALKACGLIVDDHPKWLERGPVEQVRPAEGEEWGTVIILEDVE